jgi:hypothetical protein
MKSKPVGVAIYIYMWLSAKHIFGVNNLGCGWLSAQNVDPNMLALGAELHEAMVA